MAIYKSFVAIAYRLHLEEANLQAIETVRSQKLGEPRIFNSLFAQQVEEDNIRTQKEKGGGVLDDGYKTRSVFWMMGLCNETQNFRSPTGSKTYPIYV
jgi:predicted dehydrogenase